VNGIDYFKPKTTIKPTNVETEPIQSPPIISGGYKYPFQSSGQSVLSPEIMVSSSNFKSKFLSSLALIAIAKYVTDPNEFISVAKQIDTNLDLISSEQISADAFYQSIVEALDSESAAAYVFPYTIGCLPRGNAKKLLNNYFLLKPK